MDSVPCEVRVGENLTVNRNEALLLEESHSGIPSVRAYGSEAVPTTYPQKCCHQGTADASELAALLHGQMTEFHFPVANSLPHDRADEHYSVVCNQNNFPFGLPELLADVSRKPYGTPENVPQQLIHALRIVVSGRADANVLRLRHVAIVRQSVLC